MTREDALRGLISEARATKNSNASAKRVLRICKALNLDAKETKNIFLNLEYCNSCYEPYGGLTRIW
jgi:hypothetical protein